MEIITLKMKNTHEPELIDIPITKTWDDDTDRDGLRPDKIELQLYADGELLKTATIDGSKDENTWSYTFKDLYKYRHEGILIEYTIKEIPITNSQPYDPTQKYNDALYVTGNSTTTSDTAGITKGSETLLDSKTDGYQVINKHEPERMKIKVVKEWNDDNDLDEYRPSSITLKLLANGQPAKNADGQDVSTIVLRESSEFSNIWEAEVTDLFKYYNHGTEIKYTVVEESVPEHYTVEYPEFQNDVSIRDEDGQIFTLQVKNTHEPHYDGYVEITGKVWEDLANGKANAINGKLDEGEAGLEGIKVRLRDEDGNLINSAYTDKSGKFTRRDYAETDKNGNYTIRVNYDNRTEVNKNVYKLYEDVNEVEGKLQNAYVEFEYDGMTYTTVQTATTGADTSKAIEDENARNNFDRNHTTITSTTQHPDGWTDKNITAITNGVISFASYEDKKDIKNQEVLKYCNGNGTYTRTNPEGAWNDPLTSSKHLGIKHPDHPGDCSGGKHPIMRTYDIDVERIQNVNLGLFKREQPDISIFSELSKVEVTMNHQQYTYLYNVKTSVADEKAEEAYQAAYQEALNRGMNQEQAEEYAKQLKIQAKFQNKNTYTYRRPVNPADIAYVNQVDGNAMEVYVTYKVTVGNCSTTLPMIVHNINNYYDSRYTLTTPGWTESVRSQYKTAKNVGDLNIRVEPQTESAPIELTYKVSQEAIKSLLNQEATLNNAVEIQTYSTLYGAKTLYAEQRTGGRTGKPYGGYDYDSHPGNVIPGRLLINSEARLEITNKEDDEDIAPSFVLCKDEDEPGKLIYKVLSGNVWEDTGNVTAEGGRLGDGKKTAGENNLTNAKVELYKVKDDETLELAKLYGADGTVTEKLAVTTSDGAGNYSFGDDSYGVVTDKYIIKFTYGEGIDGTTTSTINGVNVDARNFKSTIISSDTELKTWINNAEVRTDNTEIEKYGLLKENENTNDEWHLNIEKGYSVAVDNIAQRVNVQDLQYSNFGEAINISAYSMPFKMQVEFDANTDKTLNVGEDGKTPFGRELNVFDFGIVERARENIFVEKTIENIQVTLANGQVLTQGNPTTDDISYVKAPGFKATYESGEAARLASDRNLSIEIDSELIQGARLDVKYALKVTNHSELDYDYYVDGNIKTKYYYFGTNTDNSPEITATIDLVDYIDTDLTYNWEQADVWTAKTAEELANEGLISTPTKEQVAAIGTAKYQAYQTTIYNLARGTTATPQYANASKILANTDENVYENHMEILKIDAKTARTIKETDDSGIPVIKEYKMGNYVPSFEKEVVNNDISREEVGLHEQDDDRVRIVITPPTGATNYIMTYIIASLVGLIVIVTGVVFIKKKVLTK